MLIDKCEAFWQAICDVAEGGTPDAELLAHLARCARCRKILSLMKATCAALRATPGVEPPADLYARILACTTQRPRAHVDIRAWVLRLSPLAAAAAAVALWVHMLPSAVAPIAQHAGGHGRPVVVADAGWKLPAHAEHPRVAPGQDQSVPVRPSPPRIAVARLVTAPVPPRPSVRRYGVHRSSAPVAETADSVAPPLDRPSPSMVVEAPALAEPSEEPASAGTVMVAAASDPTGAPAHGEGATIMVAQATGPVSPGSATTLAALRSELRRRISMPARVMVGSAGTPQATVELVHAAF